MSADSSLYVMRDTDALRFASPAFIFLTLCTNLVPIPWYMLQDTEALRDALSGMGLIAFVGDGAILPRLAHHTLTIPPAAFLFTAELAALLWHARPSSVPSTLNG